MLLIREFKLGMEVGLPEPGFDAWHGWEVVVSLFWHLK